MCVCRPHAAAEEPGPREGAAERRDPGRFSEGQRQVRNDVGDAPSVSIENANVDSPLLLLTFFLKPHFRFFQMETKTKEYLFSMSILFCVTPCGTQIKAPFSNSNVDESQHFQRRPSITEICVCVSGTPGDSCPSTPGPSGQRLRATPARSPTPCRHTDRPWERGCTRECTPCNR